MDRGARNGFVNAAPRKGTTGLFLLALLLSLNGCHRGERGVPPTPPPGPEERAGARTAGEAGGDGPRDAGPPGDMEWLPPAVATDGGWDTTDDIASNDAANGAPVAVPTTVAPPRETVAPHESPLQETREGSGASPQDNAARSAVSSSSGTGSGETGHAEPARSARNTRNAAAPNGVAPVPPKEAPGASVPGWAKSPEELVYRVDFIGITMGYARFRYRGKVTIAGKPVYHLNVRAWTSGVLSFIFPINEMIDYYLDTETLAPVRQEFTQREKDKDDVAFYDQETGRITYRYRESGKIRKQVDTIPSVYDPVSVAYYFRWRDLGAENRPRNVYGGRKLYQISSRILGNERIHTEQGDVDTIAVLPLIRRNGKPDDKGDLKIWFSNDDRRVPVRLYAKFHKIKDWTLVGVLMSSVAEAGG
jgi:hypothetical protein